MFVQVIDTALSYHITSAFFNNPLVFQALQSMNENISPAFHSCLSDWQVTEGVLTYKGHIYVPNDDDLCHTISLHHHDHKTAGHPSSLKTCQLVVAEFWWPGLASHICKYVEGCATCQQNKANTHPTVPPLPSIKSSSCTCPFQQISCNLITSLPPFLSFDSLLVMVDHGLTKEVILCPTKKSITAKGITSLFFHKVFLHFELFNEVISDCDLQFTSFFAQELGKLLNYDLFLSTAYPLQSNGEIGWVNQEIETYLRIFCGDNPITWSEKISRAKFTHNHCAHLKVIFKTHLPTVETHLQQLSAACNEALAAHELARQVMVSCSL